MKFQKIKPTLNCTHGLIMRCHGHFIIKCDRTFVRVDSSLKNSKPALNYTHGLIMRCHGRFMHLKSNSIIAIIKWTLIWTIIQLQTHVHYMDTSVLKQRTTTIHEAGTYPKWNINTLCNIEENLNTTPS